MVSAQSETPRNSVSSLLSVVSLKVFFAADLRVVAAYRTDEGDISPLSSCRFNLCGSARSRKVLAIVERDKRNFSATSACVLSLIHI